MGEYSYKVLIIGLGNRCSAVRVTARSLCPAENPAVPNELDAGWIPEPLWRLSGETKF